MRLLLAFLLGLAVLAPVLSSVPAAAQTGFDRRGGDYTSFALRSGDPAACAARCERDSKCRAWSFSYPRTAAAQAMCWLKNDVPPRVEDKCCSSGVKGAGVIEPRTGPEEYSTDRIGGDYRTYEM
ncbi:MAG: PAN domain-containing protein, partial [Pseudolabrys sp.]